MRLLALALVCALVFLLCFLVDLLIKRLRRTSELEKSRRTVRPAHRSVVFGLILVLAPVLVMLLLYPPEGDAVLLAGSIAAFIMGVILLASYFSVAIYYDDEKFLYRSLRGGKKEYHYSQIRGQRSLLTRGGVNTILFVGDDALNLYSSMDNLNAFLRTAFFKWCQVKGIDPDSVENNPRLFTWFRDPDELGEEDGCTDK